ncbi:hypothetical protein ACFL57_01485 [Candidatus Margulisiibacteriota bacterium]
MSNKTKLHNSIQMSERFLDEIKGAIKMLKAKICGRPSFGEVIKKAPGCYVLNTSQGIIHVQPPRVFLEVCSNTQQSTGYNWFSK